MIDLTTRCSATTWSIWHHCRVRMELRIPEEGRARRRRCSAAIASAGRPQHASRNRRGAAGDTAGHRRLVNDGRSCPGPIHPPVWCVARWVPPSATGCCHRNPVSQPKHSGIEYHQARPGYSRWSQIFSIPADLIRCAFCQRIASPPGRALPKSAAALSCSGYRPGSCLHIARRTALRPLPGIQGIPR
jgi:hypothetical protein